jgi:hypothetical protein
MSLESMRTYTVQIGQFIRLLLECLVYPGIPISAPNYFSLLTMRNRSLTFLYSAPTPFELVPIHPRNKYW